MKLVSWNVNGLRSVLTKGFLDFIKKEKPDVMCLQEIKWDAATAKFELAEYDVHWSFALKKGYSGTATFTRPKPFKVELGMGVPGHDDEGRIITAEYAKFYLVNVYTPNSKRDLSRLPYREKWDKDFLAFLKKLEKKKPVVFCGDLNVAHTEIDLTNPKSNEHNHGFTPEERRGFENIVKAGFVDVFRNFHPGQGGHYTWWSQFANCRKRNIGWRIDYFCVSQALVKKVKEIKLLSQVLGSDHCPVSMILE